MKRAARPRRESAAGSAEEHQRPLEELRVHQTELEAQNEELRGIQRELLAARDRYSELYDFAPVGYVTVGARGLIVGANLTLARMLAVERGRLIGQPFSRFLARGNGDTYYLHRARVFQTRQPQVCEVKMVRKDGRQFWGRLEAMPAPAEAGPGLIYRAAVSDISGSKQVEEALRRSQEALERQREELRKLTGGMLKGHEAERHRLSREMHDDLNQRLAMLTVDVERLEQEAPTAQLRGELCGLKRRLVELTDDVRRVAHHLHPSVLEHLGLGAALRSYCQEFSRHEKLRALFKYRGRDRPLPGEVGLCLYRVAQEAMHNAARHSGAEQVTVGLTTTAREVRLAVADRGKGFNPERVRGGGGLGLISMVEWARLAGGSLVVRSHPGTGTQVRMKVPLGRAGHAGSRRAG